MSPSCEKPCDASSGVEVTLNGQAVSVKGGKGALEQRTQALKLRKKTCSNFCTT